MRVALIAIAKYEELYIEEWLNHHLDIGFDTIIVADNDDTPILSKFASDRVIIEDYCGVEGVQPKAYSELFKKYRSDFDWIFFCDIDEFVVIEDGSDVKTFLSSFDADMVRLNCKHFTDNDELDVIDGDYRVMERFKTPIAVTQDRFFKTFINCRIALEEPTIYGHGIYNKTLKAVDAEGHMCPTNKMGVKALHKVAWVNHYRTKTIGEYMRQKCFRGGANKNPKRYSEWKAYFRATNTLTDEKIAYAEKIIEESRP